MSDVVVYHFSSNDCAPCKHIKPAVADLKEEFSQYTWKSADMNKDRDLFNKFFVTNIPCIVVMKDGHEVGRHKGTEMMGYYRVLRAASQK